MEDSISRDAAGSTVRVPGRRGSAAQTRTLLRAFRQRAKLMTWLKAHRVTTCWVAMFCGLAIAAELMW